jgi:hypothetical protein
VAVVVVRNQVARRELPVHQVVLVVEVERRHQAQILLLAVLETLHQLRRVRAITVVKEKQTQTLTDMAVAVVERLLLVVLETNLQILLAALVVLAQHLPYQARL